MKCGSTHTIMILDNSLDMGGVEKKLFDLIPRFDRSHFRIVVCCLKGGGYFGEPIRKMGVPFRDDILRNKYDLLAYRRLKSLIEEWKVDLVYSFLHPNTVIFSYLARKSGLIKAWVVSVHATGSPAGGRLVKRYLTPFLGRVDRFIAVAGMHKDYLVRVERLPEGRIEVVYNGVDTERYRPGGAPPGLRESLGLSPRSRVVTTVASLKPAKRVDLFIEAAAGLAERFADVEFLVVGDGPERRALERTAGRLGIGSRVVFAGTREDVDGILRASSLLVLSSMPGTETFPNVILEAMASGVPVVSTDVGSVREMVEDGRSAVVVPPGDVSALADAMASLLADEDRMRSFGERGRRIVEDRFTLERMRAGRERIFSSLLCDTSEGAERVVLDR